MISRGATKEYLLEWVKYGVSSDVRESNSLQHLMWEAVSRRIGMIGEQAYSMNSLVPESLVEQCKNFLENQL